MIEESRASGSARPLIAAVALSVVVHGAIILLVADHWHTNFRLNEDERRAVFDLALAAPNSPRESSHRAQQGLADGNPSESAAQKNQPTATTAPGTIAPLPPSEAVEAPAVETPKLLASESFDPSIDAFTVSRADSQVLVPTPPTPHFREPPPTQAISVEQVNTLGERIRQWQQDLSQLSAKSKPIEWAEGGRTYTAEVEHLPAQSSTDLDRALVRISTQSNGQTLSTEIQLKRLAFSHFAQVVNRWDPDVAISKDEIVGRFHANSGINVDAQPDATPRFVGKVTVAGRVNMGRRTQKEEVFAGGLETRTPRIDLPAEIIPFGTSARSEQVRYFSQDTHITFYPNGEYGWRSADSPGNEQRATIVPDGFYLVAREGSELSVKGRVSGKVVVYSPRRITIAGDLTYARNPEQFPNSPDYLGLISDGYVEVGPPAMTGPGDITIQAAVYAKRRFSVRSFRNRNRGMMSIYGSVTAGSLSATEPRYATRLHFDKRLENLRPPGFPMTERYEVENWDRRWTVLR